MRLINELKLKISQFLSVVDNQRSL